jgi:membrane fusion protein, multidrug efflux system
MNKINVVLSLMLTMMVVACGGSKKDATATINDLKVQIEEQKKLKAKSDAELKELEGKLLKVDSSAMQNVKVKLVSTAPVVAQPFEHFIDLIGRIDADNISYISPSGMPGQVKAIYVKEGQFVKKGQLVLRLDDAIVNQQVQAVKQQAIAASQQLEGIRTQLSFAKNIYERQKNLWEQGIGTEVQLLTAKTTVTGLENQLAAATEQVKAASVQTNVVKAQQNTANVYSDVSGVVDAVNIRIGETFTGMGPMGPQIKVVNKSSLKVVVNVPENYSNRVQRGMPALVTIPDANRTNIPSNISLISQSIETNLRGFMAEAKIPADANLRPGQSATIRLKDYYTPSAIVVPINIVQTDEAGKYIFTMVKSSNGKAYAHKVAVTLGEAYGSNVEILGGLAAGSEIIVDGYQGLYEGQLLSTTN